MSVLFVLFVFYMLICKMDVVPKALIPPLKEHRQCAGAFFIPKKDKRTGEWHVHHGYFHTEDSEKPHEPLNSSEQKLLDNVKKIWHNRSR